MTKVVCGLIIKRGLILGAKRNHSRQNGGLWEFPGGKVESSESHYEAIVRELHEELNIHVIPTGKFNPDVVFDAISGISLHPIFCELTAGEISLKDHSEYRWFAPKDLLLVNWTRADQHLLQDIITYLNPKMALRNKGKNIR